MDLRVYYRKLREVESALSGSFIVLVSVATPDGGKAGVLTETTRHVAAKQIADGRARVATEEEAATYHSENLRKRRELTEFEQANRLQVIVVPHKHPAKPAKE